MSTTDHAGGLRGGEIRLLRILIAINSDLRLARINLELDATDGAHEAHAVLTGASQALAEIIKGTEVREMFGGEPRGVEEFGDWEFDRELDSATHAFLFDVIQPLDDPDEKALDFDVVVGETEDALPDFCAATAMLARFVSGETATPDHPAARSLGSRPE